MIDLPDGSFVRADYVRMIEVLPERTYDGRVYPWRVSVHHGPPKSGDSSGILIIECADEAQAKKLARRVARQVSMHGSG